MQEGTQVESRSAGDNRQVAAVRNFLQNRPRKANIFSRSANVNGIERIEKMVGYAPAFRRGHLCCPDIEHAVQLQRIAVNDFAAETFGDGQRKFALARTGRAEDNRERLYLFHKSMILGQNSELVTILALGLLLQRRRVESTQKASPVE